MKVQIIILQCLFFSLNAISQSDSLKIDSLKKVLLTQKEDTNKVNTLNELLNTLFWISQTDNVSDFANQSLSLSQKLGYLKGEAKSSLIISKINMIKGDLVSAFKYAQRAVDIYRKSGDDENLVDAFNWYVVFLNYQKNFKGILNIYFEAEKILLRLNDSDKLQGILGNIGITYKELGKKDSAEIYFKKAYELSTKINSDYGRVNHLISLGLLYLDEGRNDEAAKILYQCFSFSYLNNTVIWIGEVYWGVAKLYQKRDNPDSSLFYANKSFENAYSNSDSTFRIIKAAQLLSELYEEKRNYKEAFHFYKLAAAAEDSFYNGEKAQQASVLLLQEKEKEQEIITTKKEFKNKLLLYSSFGALLIIAIVTIFLLHNNRQQKRSNKKIEKAYLDLKYTQAQLIQSEKMASLGELTAGIAHEIQNPLNFVNNFSDVNKELIEEANNEIDKGNVSEVKSILTDIKENEGKINHHGKRADAIVKGMLQHSRTSTGQKELTDINALCDEYLRLAYHGLRAKDKSFNAEIKTDFDSNIEKINVVPQDMGRVLLNLFNNAFYAVNEKNKMAGENYKPLVSVKTKKVKGTIEVSVEDNGNGIPGSIKEKIFQPFFTTKPAGQGTGLGLSLSYDIVKAHGGELNVETTGDKGTVFSIQLPVS